MPSNKELKKQVGDRDDIIMDLLIKIKDYEDHINNLRDLIKGIDCEEKLKKLQSIIPDEPMEHYTERCLNAVR